MQTVLIQSPWWKIKGKSPGNCSKRRENVTSIADPQDMLLLLVQCGCIFNLQRKLQPPLVFAHHFSNILPSPPTWTMANQELATATLEAGSGKGLPYPAVAVKGDTNGKKDEVKPQVRISITVNMYRYTLDKWYHPSPRSTYSSPIANSQYIIFWFRSNRMSLDWTLTPMKLDLFFTY